MKAFFKNYAMVACITGVGFYLYQWSVDLMISVAYFGTLYFAVGWALANIHRDERITIKTR